MKQFFIYVLATIAGIWITILISILGSFLMLIMMIAAGSGSSSPEISKHSILHINLDGSIEERAQGKSLIDELQGIQNNSIPLNDLIKSIRHAATDSKIDGIYLECNGGSAGTATLAYVVQGIGEMDCCLRRRLLSGQLLSCFGCRLVMAQPNRKHRHPRTWRKHALLQGIARQTRSRSPSDKSRHL